MSRRARNKQLYGSDVKAMLDHVDSTFDWQKYRVCVTGGAGFLGRVVCKTLIERGLPVGNLIVPRKSSYDLTKEREVERLYADAQPNYVIHLAAEVGGIGSNISNPGRFFFANMAMGLHLIEHGRRNNIAKFIHTGTVCAYPKMGAIPFREDMLWDGFPEETNAPYGIAKKSLFVMLDAYHRQYSLDSAVCVPVNLYGPGDNFDPETSHVIPSLIRKCISAVSRRESHITCWGTGNSTREFLYVDDAARGIVAAAERVSSPEPINLGTGREIKIADLIKIIADRCGFRGSVRWDDSRPDGQPRRCLDTSRAQSVLGWTAETELEEGLNRAIEWWRCHRR